MERCSFFIKNRAMFGSYPTQESINELESKGVRYFIDLTEENESKITPYTTEYTYFSYPIKDHKIPVSWKTFAKFIIKVSNIIKELKSGELVYIHCKGGHGRSGVVVACILCYIFGFTPQEALDCTTKYHSNRSEMRDKWRKLGSPQRMCQKNFVYRFFDELYFFRAYKVGHTAGFSNFSLNPIHVPNIGTFSTAEAAFQAHKNLENKEYVNAQINSKTPSISKSIGKQINLRHDWPYVKDDIMKMVVKLKFQQNPDILENLLRTGLRPIIQHSKYENNDNKLGKILMNIRREYYEKEIEKDYYK